MLAKIYNIPVFFQKKTYPSAQVGQVNPPKFEKCDDMVNLTYLNDASVFHNLEGRYKAKLIHTCKYSQLAVLFRKKHRNNDSYLGQLNRKKKCFHSQISNLTFLKALKQISFFLLLQKGIKLENSYHIFYSYF